MDTDDVRTWSSGIAGIVGPWLLASPFVLDASGPVVGSNVAVGAVVLAAVGHGLYADPDVAFRSGEPPTA